MKKKFLIIFICVSLFALTTSIFSILHVVKSKTHLSVGDLVEDIMEAEELSNCRIVSIGDYSDIHFYLEKPEVSESEIDDYIEEQLEGYEQKELTEFFVYENLGFDSLEDYVSECFEIIYNRKKIKMITEKREEVINQLIDLSEFDMDEAEVLDYALTYIETYEMEAYVYNLSLELYVAEMYGLPYDDFFSECYQEAEKDIEIYLLMGAISNNEGIVVEYGKENMYEAYQEIENQVYELFIEVQSGF